MLYNVDQYGKLSSEELAKSYVSILLPKVLTMNLYVRPLLIIVLSLPGTFACAERFDFHHENVLGTSLHLQIDADSQVTADSAEARVLAEIDRLAAVFSGYDSTSELCKFQSPPIGSKVTLSNELLEVLSECERWTEASGGAFNPAVEIISREWKRSASTNTPPNPSTLASLAEKVAGKHWEIEGASGQITRKSTLPISLNAIAKGYILDHVAQLAMQQVEVSGVLVDIGGDIRAAGNLVASIAIADPEHDSLGAPAASTQSISNAGIATSGKSERGFEIQGIKYSHLLDPRTGTPVTEIVSATVVAPTACTADALATACSVMEIQDSLKLVDSIPGVTCMLISSKGQVFKSKNWTSEPSQSSPNLRTETKLVNFQSKESEPQMLIEFEITKAENAGRYRRPYVAVWIADKDGFPVKTLLLFLMKNQPGPRWHRDLRRWYADDQMRLLVDKTDMIDAVSKPTRNPGKYKVEWDGCDDAGMPLKEGEYTLFIEAAREHGTYQLMKHKFEFGGKPFEDSLKGNAEISSATVKYKAIRN